jgi:GNAT superfamily N-acetyltransferase
MAGKAAETKVLEFYDAGEFIGQSIFRVYPPDPPASDHTVASIQYFTINFGKRGRGLGRRCYTGMEQTLRKEGVEMVELMPIDHASGFWEKMGFSLKHGSMVKKDIRNVTQ